MSEYQCFREIYCTLISYYKACTSSYLFPEGILPNFSHAKANAKDSLQSFSLFPLAVVTTTLRGRWQAPGHPGSSMAKEEFESQSSFLTTAILVLLHTCKFKCGYFILVTNTFANSFRNVVVFPTLSSVLGMVRCGYCSLQWVTNR